VFDRWCLNGGVNVLAQGSTARTRFAGSALKWCACTSDAHALMYVLKID
jgi:hypothetical protein